MRSDIEYEMWVKQPMDKVMAQLEEDVTVFGVTADELNRYMLNWVTERLADSPPPEWLLKGLGGDQE